MAKEIERKFLMSIDIYDFLVSHEYLINKIDVIEQIYLSEDKDIRIRFTDKIQYHVSFMGGITSFRPDNNIEYTLTYKTGKGLQRDEYESIIDSKTYDILSEIQVNYRLHKTRYTLHTGEEIDIFKERQLCLLEKEFNSKEDADNYNIPNILSEFVEEEVTYDATYKNKMIAKWIGRQQ
jgi:CYTH domain-containing protein